MSVKWGVLGTANIARGCTIPGMKMAENCELYAIAGRNEAKVQSYKDEFGFEKAYVGYDKLLEDPEVQAVYIPLPNNLHKEWVIKALKAGKHVLCEKPITVTPDEFAQLSGENQFIQVGNVRTGQDTAPPAGLLKGAHMLGKPCARSNLPRRRRRRELEDQTGRVQLDPENLDSSGIRQHGPVKIFRIIAAGIHIKMI